MSKPIFWSLKIQMKIQAQSVVIDATCMNSLPVYILIIVKLWYQTACEVLLEGQNI